MNDILFQTHKARYWTKADHGAVRCELCPRHCLIAKGTAGFCGARENNDGNLIASSYGRVSSLALDPIEKKPLYMFHPGKQILSIGGFGCNLRCLFCQNSDISIEYDDARRTVKHLSPGDVLKLAIQTMSEDNIGVAYTYNEPLISYEFLYDCAKLVRSVGLKNVVVTNGYICKEPLESLLPLIDAMNIDLKGFSEGFYLKVRGKLEAVLETIALSQKSCHVEITTLVIPGENDHEVEDIAKWISSVDPDIPLHLSRFFPRYKYSDRAPTPRETILNLRDTAKKYLNNVFTGNMV